MDRSIMKRLAEGYDVVETYQIWADGKIQTMEKTRHIPGRPTAARMLETKEECNRYQTLDESIASLEESIKKGNEVLCEYNKKR